MVRCSERVVVDDEAAVVDPSVWVLVVVVDPTTIRSMDGHNAPSPPFGARRRVGGMGVKHDDRGR